MTANKRATILTTVDRQLAHQPTIETTNRKRLHIDATLPNMAEYWELRIGDIRVFYVVNEPASLVRVLSVGEKERNMVRIGKELITAANLVAWLNSVADED